MSQPPARAFTKVPAAVEFPKIETGILDLWRRLDAFAESNRRRKAQGAKDFVFYDGPPFATGTPHYGHLLQSTVKDVVPRYWSMRGFHVERRFGWDCHGLPIEALAQKELGVDGAAGIRDLGVARFNEQCRSMVQTYVGEWRRTIERLGRWVDFDNDYKTMDRPFMESVWWVFKRLWDQGMVYRSHRIMPYSPKLSTPLSKFEVKDDNYKDVQDPAITVRFRLVDRLDLSSNLPSLFTSLHPDPDMRLGHSPDTSHHEHIGGSVNLRNSPTYILAWTTTPWTLLSNLALCVNANIVYAIIHHNSGVNYILAKEAVHKFFPKTDTYTLLSYIPGTELVRPSLHYEPLFWHFKDTANAFRVLCDDFVTTSDGTGIVHMAPSYGEDDFRVCLRSSISLVDPLDDECRFTAKVPEYAGQFCKDADKAIIKRLKDEGKLFHQATIVHPYPFCDRTDAPLIYRAIDAWYVKVEAVRERLCATNAKIRWVPEAIGSNRFGNWLKDARDWNVSRNRFWGSCLPVWVNVADREDQLCFGSVAELEKAAGVPTGSITDLHKHHLDAIVIRTGGKEYRRTPEVFDCWFESGSMPYGQARYPFRDKERFDAAFPAEFIAEGLDQTRGWFYTLLVLSTHLFDRPAFNNVVVTGLILAEDGQKMSKSKKNYPDPNIILDQIGADALRAYLINSPVVRAEPLRFSEAGLKEIVRTVVLPYWNALSFFTTYAEVDGFDPADTVRWPKRPRNQRGDLDRWILFNLWALVELVNQEMQQYRLFAVIPRLLSFIDDLTNWYIRCSRRRFWKNDDPTDKADAYHTLFEVLDEFTRALAPVMPFVTEEVYQRLVAQRDASAPRSVHWCDYPEPTGSFIHSDRDLLRRMELVRSVVALGRKLREDHKVKVRQPLATLTVIHRDAAQRALVLAGEALIRDELNVKVVQADADEAAFCTVSVKPNFATLRKRCPAKIKDITAILTSWGFAEVAALEATGSAEVAGERITADDLLLQRQARPGAVVATDGGITVALDVRLDEPLRREGLAREFISVLQNARKQAGFEVSDRITVAWSTTSDAVRAALGGHADAIAAEVLALRFTHDPQTAGETADLNGEPVAYVIARV